MTAARSPLLGNVIWAELEDANGFRKVRPAVIVTSKCYFSESDSAAVRREEE